MKVNILLISVLILFLFFVIRGYKKGFLRIVVYFAGTIFIFIAANKLSPYLNDFIYNSTNIYSKIQGEITNKFEEKNSVRDNSISENQIATIKSYELPESIENKLIKNNTQEMYQKLLVTLFDEYVSSYLARGAIKVLSIAIAFIVLWIAFRILLGAVDLIAKIPIIKGLNKLLGGFIGFVEALLVSWVFFFFVIIFIGNDIGEAVLLMVKDSLLLTSIFNSNILLSLIP